MIEAKYDGDVAWERMDDVTHCEAAEALADFNLQSPAVGQRIVLTRDTRAPDMIRKHRVTAKLIYVVVPLRDGS